MKHTLATLVAFAFAGTASAQITVTGTGKVTYVPNMAHVNVSVSSDAKTAAGAWQKNAEIVRKLFSVLKDFHVDEKDFKTTGLHVNPRYVHRKDQEPQLVGYTVAYDLTVTVRQLDRHGALLILDEIPICLGRTGRMFAFEHYGIVPDIVVIGKGLGGAVFPMAAVIARRDLDVAGDLSLGHYTHEKSPVGCAAALATLEVIENERLLEKSRTLGSTALEALRRLKARHPLVADVRGLGLLLGIEVANDGVPARREAEQVMYECLARGLSFKVGQGNVLTLAPPLVIAPADLDRALAILDAALGVVEAEHE